MRRLKLRTQEKEAAFIEGNGGTRGLMGTQFLEDTWAVKIFRGPQGATRGRRESGARAW